MTTHNGYTNKHTWLISIHFKEDIQYLNTLVLDFESFKENYYNDLKFTSIEALYDKYLDNEITLLAKEIEQVVVDTFDDFLSDNPIPTWILDFISFENVDYYNIAQSFLDY